MTYDATDPRANLAFAPPALAITPTVYTDAEVGRFYAEPPQQENSNGKTWFVRGQNMIIAYSEAASGAVFQRDNTDEYFVLVPDHGTKLIASDGVTRQQTDGYAVLIMPPGPGELTLPEGGRFVRLFSNQSDDLAAICSNSKSFSRTHPNIPPFQPWPEPKDGYRIRLYSLDVPDEPGRFGKIWRSTTMMVNFLAPQMGPRDITKLSPHHHDDFEQCSLALGGAFVHHLRWPWTVDMRMWRDDEHLEVKSPSATIIPPPTIHTSRGIDAGANQLVDIFAPPRLDFSQKPGWVLNADEYPMPT